MIAYRTDKTGILLDQVIDLYRASGLGRYRPVDDVQRMEAMMANANLVISAWDAERLVGIARSLSDFAFCTYLSDLAVHPGYQRSGIGRELVSRTRARGGRANVFLFAAPEALEYYARIGMRAGSGWMLPEGFPLR